MTTGATNKSTRYYECDRAEMTAFLPETARTILDVGCGAGGYGRTVKTSRPATEIWGVETNRDAAQIAAGYLDRVVVGNFPDSIGVPRQYFDVVQFNDVLEHMVDPWEALRQTVQLLKPTGVVVASIPNVRYLPVLFKLLVRGEWKYAASGVLDSTHLRFFTRSGICSLFNECGYRVERILGIHPMMRWQVRFLAALFQVVADDMRYIEFAVVARPFPGQQARDNKRT